jgi:hypothetical protein
MTSRIKTVPIVCVPHRSPLVSAEGQLLLQDGSAAEIADAAATAAPAGTAEVDSADFFGYATVAKIIGFEGNATGELGLVIEGIGRVKMAGITQEKPHFEGMVDHVADLSE